jgi:hypothetical protein
MHMSQLIQECQRIAPTRNTIPSGPFVMPYRVAPTAPQIKYYTALVEGKDMPEDMRNDLRNGISTLSKQEMNAGIGTLMARPWKPKPTPQPFIYRTQRTRRPILAPTAPTIKIPEGYYAVVDPLDSMLKFFRVRAPKRGKWAGYRFLTEVSGEMHLRTSYDMRLRILPEIAKDTTAALKRFGKEIGQCGHCRKQLTDTVSRDFGIGPVCRKALGI